MKRPSFLQGVLVAAVLAFVASAVIATLTPFVGIGSVVRLAIPGISLVYILYLLRASNEQIGNITTLSLWSALAVIAWWVAPPLPFYVLIHVGAIWLVRSLYFYSGVFPAVMDLGLTALSVSAFVVSMTRTGSVFIATWTFLLVQALFVAIPPVVGGNRSRPETLSQGFSHARKQADAALRQLMSR